MPDEQREWQGNFKACLDIAHYNYRLRFGSCGLFRGIQGAALKTREGAALDPVGWPAAPDTPDQRVTLSLETPRGNIALKTPIHL